MSSKSNLYFQQDNISSVFLTTARAMILLECAGGIAILIDGIITSQFLGADLYAGISLLRPFSRILLALAGFLSTGCAAVCGRLVAQGKRKEANGAFNFTILLALAISAVIILFCILFPMTTLRLCGVSFTKAPDLIPSMYAYLQGYLIGAAPLILNQILGPILVMDGGGKIFTGSVVVLCIFDIIGDLCNVFVFHGGVFGIGIVTSIGYIMQMLVLLFALCLRKGYFHLSFRSLYSSCWEELSRLGTPAFAKRLAAAVREPLINYINIALALSYVAISVRGLQGDLSQFLFCVPAGLGRALIVTSGVYYRANDRQGLQCVYAFALRLGFRLSVIAGASVFLIAPLLVRIYTGDPQVISLGIFSLRWMALGMLFNTSIVIYQSYLQSTGKKKASYAVILADCLLIPVLAAFVLGMLFGSAGVLASQAISKMFMILAVFLINCIRCRGIPQEWKDVMLLPADFGGAEEDNIYAEIRTMEDVVRESKRANDFCLAHHTGSRPATLTALFVEEMAGNVVQHAKKTGRDDVFVNYRLFADHDRICLSIMDLGDRFDPAAFYEMYHDDSPEKHIGIRLVMNMATEVRYYNTYSSNNLTIFLEMDSDR